MATRSVLEIAQPAGELGMSQRPLDFGSRVVELRGSVLVHRRASLGETGEKGGRIQTGANYGSMTLNLVSQRTSVRQPRFLNMAPGGMPS